MATIDERNLLHEIEKERAELNAMVEQARLNDKALCSEEIVRKSQKLDVLIAKQMK